jgi:hypothetical protein
MHIPAWFPGAQFKRDALYSRKLARRALDEPFDFVKSEMVTTLSHSIRGDVPADLDLGSRNCFAIFGVRLLEANRR